MYICGVNEYLLKTKYNPKKNTKILFEALDMKGIYKIIKKKYFLSKIKNIQLCQAE